MTIGLNNCFNFAEIKITIKIFNMKKILCTLMALLMLTILPFQSFAQATVNKSTRLIKGTEVIIKTSGVITSNSIGNISAIVDQDVCSSDGSILIKSGTPVVINASIEKNGATGKPGKITLSGATTTAVDGKSIVLNCGMEEKGKGKGGLAWGLGIGTGLFTLFGLLFLLIKGGNAEIPAGTIIPNTFVSADYDINVE